MAGASPAMLGSKAYVWLSARSAELLLPIKPVISIIAKTTEKNTKNSIFAMPAAANAMPPKPRTPAMIAIIRNISAQ